MIDGRPCARNVGHQSWRGIIKSNHALRGRVPDAFSITQAVYHRGTLIIRRRPLMDSVTKFEISAEIWEREWCSERNGALNKLSGAPRRGARTEWLAGTERSLDIPRAKNSRRSARRRKLGELRAEE